MVRGLRQGCGPDQPCATPGDAAGGHTKRRTCTSRAAKLLGEGGDQRYEMNASASFQAITRRQPVARKSKMEKTMHEFKEGALHSGSKSGPKVKSRKQAIAIGMSQQRKAGGKGGKSARMSSDEHMMKKMRMPS
jgi:hypothetical protein